VAGDRRRGRRFPRRTFAEAFLLLCGALAAGLAAVSASITLAGGCPPPLSLALWALLAGRAVPSILYVCARLRRLHGEAAPSLHVVVAHAAALTVAGFLTWAKLTPRSPL
jgi:hypothetical protein